MILLTESLKLINNIIHFYKILYNVPVITMNIFFILSFLSFVFVGFNSLFLFLSFKCPFYHCPFCPFLPLRWRIFLGL